LLDVKISFGTGLTAGFGAAGEGDVMTW